MHHHDAEVAKNKLAKRSATKRHWKTKMWKRRTAMRQDRAAAIRQARKAIDDLGKRGDITLIYAGGIRNGADVAKAIALGADAIALGHSVMMALNCNKDIPEANYPEEIGAEPGYCYNCHTGRCPVGVATQDPVLRARLDPDAAAERVYNFQIGRAHV